jgi:hypothetical protein
VIRHVQTTDEIRFEHIADALSFIAAYVDIVEGEGGHDAAESVSPDIARRGPMDGTRQATSQRSS